AGRRSLLLSLRAGRRIAGIVTQDDISRAPRSGPHAASDVTGLTRFDMISFPRRLGSQMQHLASGVFARKAADARIRAASGGLQMTARTVRMCEFDAVRPTRDPLGDAMAA